MKDSIRVLRIAKLCHQCPHAVEIEIRLRELGGVFETIIYKRVQVIQRQVVGSVDIGHGMDCKAEVLGSKSVPRCWER